MGLTFKSTGSKLNKKAKNKKNNTNYTVAIAGNPNVGKSTIFNSLTGMNQHTGNWPGKTVENATGICNYDNNSFLLVDIPGTYSLMSNSEEEQIARDYICFGNSDCILVVIDATRLERNLNLVYQILEINKNVVLCVNLLDEAKKKGINIDLNLLSKYLGIPVVGTIASKPKTLKKLLKTINSVCIGDISCNPIKVKYIDIIEKSIDILRKDVTNILPKKYLYLSKWICLKLIDNNESIISSIEKNLNISLKNNKSIKKKLNEINKLFKENNISDEDVKDKIVSSIMFNAENICNDVCDFSNIEYNKKDKKIDKILTSKLFGFPIMLAFLGIIMYITISLANYPSQLLFNGFAFIKDKLIYLFEILNTPLWIKGLLIDGMYQTLTWIIAVMLPPMAIFFPLFTLLEDLGFLPRIAFNLDNFFRKACSTGKQALTMCMGFGCNAAGVVGCRIIDSPREKLIAILTNSFVPCNGRFPFLITVATFFVGTIYIGKFSNLLSTLLVLLVIVIGIFLTLLISKLLSKTLLKGKPSSFVLELPPYRKPQIRKIIIRSIFDRTIFVLARAVAIAAPAGIVIWLFANISINNISLITHIANFLDPFANLMGLDGYILTAFILGIPANEIVLPIILMCYMSNNALVNIEDSYQISKILLDNGWTYITAINVMLFTLLHFPCSTTLLTIKKETNSLKWTVISFLLPTICGILICLLTNGIYNLFV